MQYEDALKLQEKWGDKPCDHPSITKEYYLSAHTGDYVCETCGYMFSGPEYDEFLAERRKKAQTL